MSSSSEQDYPGGRLGLPPTGPGAVAGWGRRVVALFIDWGLSVFAVSAFVGRNVWGGESSAQVATLTVFAFEVWILTTLLGGSAGQVIMGIMVRRTGGEPLDIFRALLRTILICLVIPPLVFNPDQQGLHDLAADSIAVRRR